jgi:hypothetical protein
VDDSSDLVDLETLDVDTIVAGRMSDPKIQRIVRALLNDRDETKHKLDETEHKLDETEHKLDETEHKLEDMTSQRDVVKLDSFNRQFVPAVELVNSPQPTVMYTMKRNGGTISATAMKPVRVELWPNFIENQTEYSDSRLLRLKEQERFIMRHNTPTSCTRNGVVRVHLEADLQNLAENVIYPTLSELMMEDDTWLVTSSKRMCSILFPGDPDGVTVLWHKDSTTGDWTLGEPIRSWENKPDIIMHGVVNVKEEYNHADDKNGPWFRIITQITGNMVCMNAKKPF